MQTDDLFPTETTGLPRASGPSEVRLGNTDRFEFSITPVSKRVGESDIRMLAYNGSIPGPTLRVKQGSAITVRTRNEGDIETTVHWHGLRLDNRSDGVPVDTQAPIGIGEEYTCTVQFPDAGIYWYHPHLREDFAQEMGLYGAVIVEPSDPAYWPLVDRELTITLDDVLIEDGKMAPFHRSGPTHTAMGRFGNEYLINGETRYETTVAAGEVVRLFLINTANTRIFNIALPGARMKLVGGDSGRYEHESFVDEILLAPSERAAVDVRFAGAGVLALEHRTPDETIQLGAFVVSGTSASSAASSFDELRTDPELSALRRTLDPELQRAPDKVLAFVASMPLLYGDTAPADEYVCPMHPEVTSKEAGRCPKCGMKLVPKRATGASSAESASESKAASHGHGGHSSHHHGDAGHRHHGGAAHQHHGEGDGLEWSDEMPDINRASDSANMLWKIIDRATGDANHGIGWSFTVGDRVKIRLVNEMESDHPMHHPFHVHGAGRFIILARNGVTEPNLGWKDTVLVRAGETVDILLEITNPGSWMAHCHIAEHIEAGMMFSFNVRPRPTEDAMQAESQQQVLDPVCGMMILPADAAATRDVDGKTYYLCSSSCAAKFDADAIAYIAAARSDGYNIWHGAPPEERAPHS